MTENRVGSLKELVLAQLNLLEFEAGQLKKWRLYSLGLGRGNLMLIWGAAPIFTIGMSE